MSRLRDALGLDDPDLARRAWQAVAGQRYDDERLARLHESLAGAQARIALARQALLSALDAWLADQRSARGAISRCTRGGAQRRSRIPSGRGLPRASISRRPEYTGTP